MLIRSLPLASRTVAVSTAGDVDTCSCSTRQPSGYANDRRPSANVNSWGPRGTGDEVAAGTMMAAGLVVAVGAEGGADDSASGVAVGAEVAAGAAPLPPEVPAAQPARDKAAAAVATMNNAGRCDG